MNRTFRKLKYLKHRLPSCVYRYVHGKLRYSLTYPACKREVGYKKKDCITVNTIGKDALGKKNWLRISSGNWAFLVKIK